VLIAALGALGLTLALRRDMRADLALPFGTALVAAAGVMWLMEKTLI